MTCYSRGGKATRTRDADCGDGCAHRPSLGKRGRGATEQAAPFDRACCRMYQMKMAQRSSNPTDPTSTTCAHNGITSFADGGKAGIGDCGGGAGGVNGVGGGGGGGCGGDGHSATAVCAALTCESGVSLAGHASKREMHASAVQS